MTVHARSSTLLHRIRQESREFEHSRPGRRFTQRYERRQRSGTNSRKALKMAIGCLVLLLGIVLLFLPGPGLLVVLLGAGLIAEQSYNAARALDKAEVRARRLGAAALRAWRRTPTPAKIVLLAAATLAAVAFAAYVLMRIAA